MPYHFSSFHIPNPLPKAPTPTGTKPCLPHQCALPTPTLAVILQQCCFIPYSRHPLASMKEEEVVASDFSEICDITLLLL